MSDSKIHCPTCDAPIPSFEPGGNCPRCLFKKPVTGGAEDSQQDEGLPEVENCRVHRLIGEGGFGLVYRATQLKPVHREVAIKVLKPGMDSGQILARFEAERQALALMDHPNVARIYDAGETGDGRPFFTMELVEGLPLNQHCREKLPDLKSRLKLFLEACEAVTHAHQKGLIHRDLKPANILVGDRLKVIDFGIAKATEHVLSEATLLTGEAQMLGTPEYMSPEQADGGSLGLDTRTDVYSLGAVLYELVAGAPPFLGKELRARGLAEILRIIREEDPPRPSTRMTEVSRDENWPNRLPRGEREVRNDLDWVVMRALSKDRERRYDTVSGLARDARHFLNHEPVSARPPSLLYQLSKMVRDLKLSDDGRVVYTASHDGKVRAFEEGKSESLWEVEYGERVICLEVSPDGSRVVAGFGDGVVMVLGADDGEVILNKKCHAAPVMQVAFLGGNERFATGALDGRARVWLVAGGEGANT